MPHPPYTVTLSPGHPVSLWLSAGQVLRVLNGTAWITQSDDPQDHVLHAQQQLQVRGGRVVVEALSQTALVQVQVVDAAGARNGATDPETAVARRAAARAALIWTPTHCRQGA